MAGYRFANTDEDYEVARVLFREYGNSLNNELALQNFDEELINIRSIYGLPEGGIVLAHEDGLSLGCSGIKKLEPGVAELKRYYVRPAFRGRKIGLAMIQLSIQFASDLGYNKIKLNSLPEMKRAQEIYYAIGFYEIPAYFDNGIPGTIFMEKNL